VAGVRCTITLRPTKCIWFIRSASHLQLACAFPNKHHPPLPAFLLHDLNISGWQCSKI